MRRASKMDLVFLAAAIGLAIFTIVLAVQYLDGRPAQPTPVPAFEPSIQIALADLRLTTQAGSAQLEQTLTASIIAAADYLVRDQLSNGDLPYQVTVPGGNRGATPNLIRQVAGAGSLYTACRVTGDGTYCQSADRALAYFLNNIVRGDHYPGACLFVSGRCSVGANALTIDAIYKRWQALGSTDLNGMSLMGLALDLGENTAWMQREDGSLYHAFDPFPGGGKDAQYYVVYFNGETLMAWLQLYELTGDPAWLERSRALNAFMLQQEITQDHWHAYSFMYFARLDSLTTEDANYASQIAGAIISDEGRLLAAEHSAISSATKVEALAGIATAFATANLTHDWIAPELEKFASFMLARQLPANLCGWSVEEVQRYTGGIYRNCEEPYIRIDANQHWINGSAAYLEYLRLLTGGESS